MMEHNQTSDKHDYLQAEGVKIRSIAKAMHVLECFTIEQPELGITEISAMLDIQKSTVYNILATFEAMGYVTQDPITNRYRLGFKLMQFSYIINNQIQLQKLFMPYIKKIALQLHERVLVAVPYGTNVMYLESYEDVGFKNTRSMMGAMAPMYCTGVGKAILAHIEDYENHLPAALESYTNNTITDFDQLRKEMEETRARGYAIDNMEHEFGVKCVAVPIWSMDHKVIASISASGPSLRFTDSDISRIAQFLQETLQPLQYSISFHE